MRGNPSNADLATMFNVKHGVNLKDQTLKLSEEVGEVAEAVLGVGGDLLFKEGATNEDVADELADLFATGYYVADLAGVDEIDQRVRKRLVANLEREDA